MSSKNLSICSHDSEEEVPVAPFTKCTAMKDFPGEQSNDLPFRVGEVLTIIEPCNVVYWYLAENSAGKRGIIPITYVLIHTASDTVPQTKRPPPPLPPGGPSSEPSHPRVQNSSPPMPPLPPKPQTPRVPAPTTKTYLTYPRHTQVPPPVPRPHHKVTRVHSNEFHGAQRTQHSPLLSTSLTTSSSFKEIRSHQRHSTHINKAQPVLPPSSPSHSPLSNVPPPLPSPRNRVKPVPPPMVPRTYSSDSSPPPVTPRSNTLFSDSAPSLPPKVVASSQTLPLSPSSHKKPTLSSSSFRVQSRDLPMVPPPSLPSANSDPSLDIDRRPPAPLPSVVSKGNYVKTKIKQTTTKYRNQKEFSQSSGWFTPNLETVLCKMMYSGHISALTSVTTGVYIFTHKHQRTKRYVGKSRTAYHDLVQMFHRLFEKKEDKLSALEKELKYNSPDAEQWTFRIYSVSNPDSMEAEANKRILINNTLHPSGLNTEVKFTTKESFYQFAEEYSKVMRERATKSVNPIRAARSSTDV